jgi:hypothetical protein
MEALIAVKILPKIIINILLIRLDQNNHLNEVQSIISAAVSVHQWLEAPQPLPEEHSK